MITTNWRQIACAAWGAAIGAAVPVWLHIQALRVGDAELWGMPLAIYSLPAFFLGAILGAHLGRKKN